MDLAAHTLKGIHTLRKDRKTQTCRCSPWGTKVKPFPSLQKKMMEYLRQRQAIANPFANRSYPSRPKPSTFAQRPKATFIIRRNLVTRPHKDKLSKPRKINVGYHPGFLQCNWLAIVSQRSGSHRTGPHPYPTSCSISCTYLVNGNISHPIPESPEVLCYMHPPQENVAQLNIPYP